jgi:putative SOS response-associated peptidase YedK
MCGRYRLSRRKQIVEEYFDSVSGEGDWSPRYNIAPTQPVIALTTPEHAEELVWGLIPSWAKDIKIGSKMINARAETVATKNSYRKALVRRADLGDLRAPLEGMRKGLDPSFAQPL